jgi:hypothetical protein
MITWYKIQSHEKQKLSSAPAGTSTESNTATDFRHTSKDT